MSYVKSPTLLSQNPNYTPSPTTLSAQSNNPRLGTNPLVAIKVNQSTIIQHLSTRRILKPIWAIQRNYTVILPDIHT